MEFKNSDLLFGVVPEARLGSTAFQRHVTDLTQKMQRLGTIDNAEEYAKTLLLADPRQSIQTVSDLIPMIGEQIIKAKKYENPLKSFVKTGDGRDIQEIHQFPIESSPYDVDVSDILKTIKSNSASLFYTKNRYDKYAIEIFPQDIKRATKSDTGLGDLITQKVTNMLNSAERDEQAIITNLFTQADADGAMFHVQVDDMTEFDDTGAKARKFRFTIGKHVANLMDFEEAQHYNKLGAPTFIQDPKDLVFITTPEVAGNLKNALANIYHKDLLEIEQQMKVLPRLNIKGAQAIALHKDFLVIREDVHVFDNFHDGSKLSEKTWLHIQGIYSYSKALPCILFTSVPGDGLPEFEQNLTGLKVHVEDKAGKTVTTAKAGIRGSLNLVRELEGEVKSTPEGLDTSDFELVPTAVTTEVTAADASGKDVKLSSRTHVDMNDRIYIEGELEKGTVITIKATSTYIDPRKTNAEQTQLVAETKLTIE